VFIGVAEWNARDDIAGNPLPRAIGDDFLPPHQDGCGAYTEDDGHPERSLSAVGEMESSKAESRRLRPIFSDVRTPAATLGGPHTFLSAIRDRCLAIEIFGFNDNFSVDNRKSPCLIVRLT
ncbi:MAG TPA: hypothetical protein VIM11_02590, partial [Tepidisphaeraceae bacterium]